MLQLQEDSVTHNQVNSLLPIDEQSKRIEVESTEVHQQESTQEEEFDLEEDPATVQTKHNFVTSPWSKLVIIGGAFGAAFLVVFIVLNNLSNTGTVAKKTETRPKVFTDVKPLKEKPEDEAVGRVALIKQKDELETLNKQEDVQKSSSSEVIEKPADQQIKRSSTEPISTSRTASSINPPTRRSYAQETSSPPVSRVRRSYTLPSPTSRAYPSSQRDPVRTRPTSTENSSQLNTVNFPPPPPAINNEVPIVSASSALVELERLRSLGSIGQIEYKTVSLPGSSRTTSASTEESIPEETEEIVGIQRRRLGNQRTANSRTNASKTTNTIEQLSPLWEPSFEEKDPSTTDSLEYANYNRDNSDILNLAALPNNSNREKSLKFSSFSAEEKLILEGSEPQYLVVGSFANATLITPLLASQTTNNGAREQVDPLRFVAVLDEPLYSNTGKIAIPAKTQLIIAVSSVSPSSRVSAEVVAIIKDKTEYPISPGVISVLGKAGEPLIARPFDNKGPEIAKYDLTLGSLAGLAQLGEIINEPDEEVVEDLPFGGTRTRRSRNNNRSLEGAFIEGLFGNLTQSIGERTDTSIKEIISRPVDWYVPKNTEITIEVNKSIKL